MKTLALLAIRLYQRFISPHKGFACAYRHATGRASCSALGYRAIRRYGLIRGVRVLRRRLGRCSEHYHRHGALNALPHGQRGYCDAPCDVDAGSIADGMCSVADCASDCADFGDCDNLWPKRKTKRSSSWR